MRVALKNSGIILPPVCINVNLSPADRSGVLVQFQASRLTFTCEQPIPWTVDGEFGGSQTVNQLENCQKALRIIRGE